MKRNQLGLFPSFNTFFDDVLGRGFFELDSPVKEFASPATNIKETDEAFLIELAVPGFDKKDFKLEVKDNTLLISSTTQEEKEEKAEDGTYTHREFSLRQFKRSFTLPKHVDTQAIKASYDNGLLLVSLPKVEKKDNRLTIDVA